jgi:hypothetical protein
MNERQQRGLVIAATQKTHAKGQGVARSLADRQRQKVHRLPRPGDAILFVSRP